MQRSRSRSPRSSPLVSLIVPCYNGEAYLEACLESVAAQTYRPLELSFWNDASSDGSLAVFEQMRSKLETADVRIKIGCTSSGTPGGAGHAKREAIKQSNGEYLCFFDCDDVSLPERVRKQLKLAMSCPDSLVGCNFVRDPTSATPDYTKWLNDMTEEQLYSECFCECTLIMPTWFCHRDVISRSGGLISGHAGTVEDLLFFHEHLKSGKPLRKVAETLVIYRQHPGQISVSSVPFVAIWTARISFLASHLLAKVEQFAICGAGRDGKKLYRQLPCSIRSKCKCFVEVDPNKLSSSTAGLVDKELDRRVPVAAYGSDLPKPLVVCWKRGFDSAHEAAMESLGLIEGTDYIHFFRRFS